MAVQMTIAAWAGLEAKDWVSSSIAVLALASTIWLGIWANRKNAAAQRRQQALAEAQHDTNTRLVDVMAELAKRADPGSSNGLIQVQWAVEHVGKNRWLVRNVGAVVAPNVTVDKAALGGVRVDITPDLPADVRPGESVTIVAIGAWGSPVADEVQLTWGSDQRATLPLPRWQ